ncbi:MAG: type IV pilus twitching motility protein PilT [Deltaproteobacteria bacterium]|nr:type IV pilus twitching motility protein PilT [Deltaproteobacteria bacterium]MBW1930837.1 type IV pilus twitching motility protein PilT [Deltaproteobacteria bacterium]MBW2025647.1 type IV pilus twitching motility protein PilT [Deltaproteobacteria bacterium]MBW2125722.1 type IV pilus twitching motility protein PilT [Deltaproteobacteria bacterium]RLB21436.1 MAG: type IV pili twitching motility protein PilT [Deltaproteobacteria bacterium]
MAKIDVLLKLMLEYGASDLHISAGEPPILRINGRLQRTKYHDLTREEVEVLLLEILDEERLGLFKKRKDIDFAYELEGIGRFRANVFMERRGYGGAFRLIPNKIRTLRELGIPESVYSLARVKSGLVLVTGATGSGKSTTLAAMLDLMNKEKHYHIITLEDPIEFIHPKGKCLIQQRQLDIHMESFSAGLRAALREDPDVVLVGEMRDLETIQLALTAAETGLLVLGTLHTSSAPKTVDRIIDVFPTTQQAQIRTMLAESLRGVVAQQLLRTADGKSRVAAVEVMICTPAIQNLIREAKTYQIPSAIQTGRSLGMQTMDDHIKMLLERGIINEEEAGIYQNKIDTSSTNNPDQ